MGGTQFKCPFCDKGFSVERQLTGHEYIYTGEKPFTYKVCEKGFSGNYT